MGMFYPYPFMDISNPPWMAFDPSMVYYNSGMSMPPWQPYPAMSFSASPAGYTSGTYPSPAGNNLSGSKEDPSAANIAANNPHTTSSSSKSTGSIYDNIPALIGPKGTITRAGRIAWQPRSH